MQTSENYMITDITAITMGMFNPVKNTLGLIFIYEGIVKISNI